MIDYLTFIGEEQRRSNVMTSATIQLSCKKFTICIGCFDGSRINPRNLKERKKALYMYKNQFCFFWKSEKVSFHQAIEE